MARKSSALAAADAALTLSQDVRARFATFSFAGTYGSAVVCFEGSNGTDAGGTKRWFAVEAVRLSTNDPVAGNIGLSDNSSVGFLVFAPGCVEVRARIVSIGSGSVQAVASSDDLGTIPLTLPPAAAAAGVEVVAADGAIASKSGVVIVTKTGSACVMTLAAPSAGADDGKRLLIVTATAQAHTVTVTAGFNGGGSGTDVATFTAAIGNGFEIVAYNGVWYTVSLRNVTLG